LFDEKGQPCLVTFATPIQYNRFCYRVTFSDGESIVCDGDHLWSVEDRWSRQNPLVISTKKMIDRVELPTSNSRKERRYRVPVAGLLRCSEQNLPIHPYVLGYWLGDGSRCSDRITVHDDDLSSLLKQMESCGENAVVRSRKGQVATVVVGKGHKATRDKTRRLKQSFAAVECGVPTELAANWSGLSTATVSCIQTLNRWDAVRKGKRSSLMVRLRELGILEEKSIPDDYLRSAPWQRLALLQGLMDSDGTVPSGGRCEITLKDDSLGRAVGDLLSGLGIKWTCHEKWVTRNDRRFGPYLRYLFTAPLDLPVFRLQRKKDRLCNAESNQGTRYRQIVSIEPVPSVPVKCIQVNSPSHLYLAGRKMVPTHNTTICECACIWAVLNGHREFVCLIGSDEGHAMDMLESIKTELDANELLLIDYPEVCQPIQALDGIANRCNGQLYQGERTHIGWTAKYIVLPTLQPDGWSDDASLGTFVREDGRSLASGAVIKVAGITGRIRGMKFKRPDGKSVRPSLVVLDDPQTDESARSVSQCQQRESILAGAVLGLAGPGHKISGIMPCTVIRPGDMADRILNRDHHPQWQGERTKMVDAFPSETKLWDRYAELRAEGLRNEDGGQGATEFYKQHREQMDAGARIAWPERFNHDELSAIQHAMNLKLQDEAAFWAEYQNEPLPEVEVDENELTADQIAAKLNGLPKGRVPLGCQHLTMFIDVQQKLLFYVIAAWGEEFTGSVIDYGAFPDPHRWYFTLRDVTNMLSTSAPGTGLEGAIYSGLQSLTGRLLDHEWPREDGAMMKIERCLIDANWGSSTDVVYQFCRQSPHAALLLPSHGRFVGASSVPMNQFQRKPGERIGLNWRIPNVMGRRVVRHVTYDTNFWKSFIHGRLAVATGDQGALTLFGRTSDQHRLFAEHLTAEYRVRTQGRGRTVDEWKPRPNHPDNHWFDGIVGCAVAGSILGATLTEHASTTFRKASARIKLSELQRR